MNRPVARHNHPVSDPPPPPKLISAGGPAGEGARGKFEVKLVWEKQQPTLETTLEYLDNVDTDQTLLKWEARKEAFSGTVRLSPGEHTGSLAIPDTELVVYEVHPFNVSQYSVSVQEIKLDLVDIAPRYNAPPEPLKRPLYSQIGNLIMSIINIFLLKLKSVYWLITSCSYCYENGTTVYSSLSCII